jgi:hydrogenase expression/formation protein HypD
MSGLRYLDEFRDPVLGRALFESLHREVRRFKRDSPLRIMEFCGGHTHALYRFGLLDRLPEGLRMIHGPGCPVCILPVGRIDAAIRLAFSPEVILVSYGDVLRVPGSGGMTLMTARSQGADVRIICSAFEGLALACRYPDRKVVFFAIGFETTTPPTAAVLVEARRNNLDNYFVFSNHVLTPPAMRAILSDDRPETFLDGIIGPSHVSTLIGSKAYEPVARDFRVPIVIAGFEPLDILLALHMIVIQVGEQRAEVENEYRRAVTPDGNTKSRELVRTVFEEAPSFEWRGLGLLPQSSLGIRKEFAGHDAECHFDVAVQSVSDPRACECGEILKGLKHPKDCRIFGTLCTPETPVGSCMVSAEGACAAVYHYGAGQDRKR